MRETWTFEKEEREDKKNEDNVFADFDGGNVLDGFCLAV